MVMVYLNNPQSSIFFSIIIVIFILSQIGVTFATYKYNRKYISQKDRRLKINICSNNKEELLAERSKELNANQQFLLIRMFSRMVSVVFPIVLNVYIFLVADYSIVSSA